MSPDIREQILRLCLEAGFARVGIARAGPVTRAGYIDHWLDQGRAGSMTYLNRHRALRRDPRSLLDGARSVIVLADLYRHSAAGITASPDGQAEEVSSPSDKGGPLRGKIARYAWGRDYHKVLRRKLHRLADRLREELGVPFETRVCVDTAPLVERAVAELAGVGWIGKNTMILHQEIGSYFFLGEILTTLDLEPTPPVTDHCGSCTRCLDACPTDAFIGPYQMDATRCISYWTIEHRGDVPSEMQTGIGEWLFGCDVCQEVCPYNNAVAPGADTAYTPMDRNPLTPLAEVAPILSWDAEDYQRNLAGSAMKRATLEMLKRNARIVLNNARDRSG